MTGLTLSEDLALLLLNFPEWIEQAAQWVLLGVALLTTFALAWLIQASRRRKVVFRLWQAHQRQQQEQLEECRLLAEDQAIEQASRLAYQARRIEQLKAVIARQQGHPPVAALSQTMSVPCLPAPAHSAAHQTAATAVAAPLSAASASPNATTAHAAATPSMAPHALAAQAQAQARIREMMQTMVKQRLARELALARERARLLRRYEAESAYWQQACEHRQTVCDNLQAAVTALESALHDTRVTWAAAEREVERLREQLLQQQAKALAPLVDIATTHGRFNWQKEPAVAPKGKHTPSRWVQHPYSTLIRARHQGASVTDVHADHHS